MTHGSQTVLVTDADVDRGAIDAALAMTEEEGAHLDILCLGIETTPVDGFLTGTAVLVALPDRRAAEAHAEEIATRVGQLIPAWRSNVHVHRATIPAGHMRVRLGAMLRFSDRAILTAPYDPERRERPAELAVLDAALAETGISVVVVPEGGAVFPAAPARIAVAWDGSRAAMTAVRTALPVLRRAALVEVVIIGPEAEWEDPSEPGAALALFLARNGVRAEVSVLARSRPRISEVLSRHLIETGAEAVVMGAYGHSRIIEALFGGTTRDMIESVPVPLMLAR